MASPFGTIHAATFSFPQPVGTQIPDPPSLPARQHRRRTIPETTGALGRDPFGNAHESMPRPPLDFPAVNRRLKGDLLVTRPREAEPGSTRSDAGPGEDRFVPEPAAIRRRARRRDDEPIRPRRKRASDVSHPRSRRAADSRRADDAAERPQREQRGRAARPAATSATPLGEGDRHHPALAGGRGGADRDAARPRSGYQALGAGVDLGD